MEAVATGRPPEAETPPPKVFHCGRCGVASAEPTGFVIPEKHTKGPRDTRCVTCETERIGHGLSSGLLSTLGLIAVTSLLYAGLNHSTEVLSWSTALASALLLPVALVMHELGHAITARLCRLEVGAIMIGQGRELGSFEFFGLHFRIRAWPLFGMVVVGTADPQLSGLRTRLWLTFLMGPMTNALLVAIAVAAWPFFVSVMGEPIATIWVILNVLIFLSNIVPYSFEAHGRRMSNDGLALLQIPRYTKEHLAAYLLLVPSARAWFEFQDENFEAARAAALQGLERAPGNSDLLVTLSACECRLENYCAAVAILRPMLDAPEHAGPRVRATVRNNLAVALWFPGDATARAAALEEVDKLSATAFEMYPSILSFRSTRALMLTACGRPSQALEILEYRHYASAPRDEKSFQHAARAFALAALGRSEESHAAIERAMKLRPKVVDMLRELGLQPAKSAA